MVVVSMQRRTINLNNSQAPKVQGVVADIMNAVRPYNPLIETSQDGAILRVEVLLTTTQDSTLQASMAGWAARLGLTQLDTHVVAVSAGHA